MKSKNVGILQLWCINIERYVAVYFVTSVYKPTRNQSQHRDNVKKKGNMRRLSVIMCGMGLLFSIIHQCASQIVKMGRQLSDNDHNPKVCFLRRLPHSLFLPYTVTHCAYFANNYIHCPFGTTILRQTMLRSTTRKMSYCRVHTKSPKTCHKKIAFNNSEKKYYKFYDQNFTF